MPNVNKPAGLSPVQYLNGSPWTGGGRVYCIPSSDSTNAYAVGDPVIPAGSADTNGIPTITLATAGSTNTVGGVIVSAAGANVYGGSYGSGTSDAIPPLVIPATKARNYYVLVCDDPNVVFEIQEGGSDPALAAAAVSLNCSLLAGTNNGYVSGWTLDNTTEATTAALQLRLLQLAPRADNAFGQYAKWWVLINNHQFRTGVAGY